MAHNNTIEPTDEPVTKGYAVVTRDAFNMKRSIAIYIRGTTVVIEDYLNFPIESCLRTQKTTIDIEMFDELIEKLGYRKVNRS